jgi:hypothetical protein
MAGDVLTALANAPLWLWQASEGIFIVSPLLLATAWLVWMSKRWFPDAHEKASDGDGG